MRSRKGLRSFVYLVLASALLVGAAAVSVAPDVEAGCSCQGGYHYADDMKPCTTAGTNCAVCNCWDM